MTKQNNYKSGIYKGVASAKPDNRLEKETTSQFPLGRNNFILMGIAGVLIILGFLLMLGGSSTEEAFNPDIFSGRRIVVGPTIAFLGFLFMGYGIIRKPKIAGKENAPLNVDDNKIGN